MADLTAIAGAMTAGITAAGDQAAKAAARAAAEVISHMPAPAPAAPGKESKRIPPPTFVKEDPEGHLMKVEDWFLEYSIADAQRPVQFRHTLAKQARHWYSQIDVPNNWEDLKTLFRRRFSKQGRSREQLHETWRNLRFDLNDKNQDLDTFITEVRETATQLGYDDIAQITCIKSQLPLSCRAALRQETTLPEFLRALQELLSLNQTKSEPNPFAMMQSETDIDELSDKLSVMNTRDSRPYKKPYKPSVTTSFKSQRKRDDNQRSNRPNNRYQNRGPRQNNFRGRRQGPPNRNFRGNFQNQNFQQQRGFRNFRGQNRPFNRNNQQQRPNQNRQMYQSSPNQPRPRVASRTYNQDRDRCFYCHNFGHWANQCPEKGQNIFRPRQQYAPNGRYPQQRRPRDNGYSQLTEAELGIVRNNMAMIQDDEDDDFLSCMEEPQNPKHLN